MEFVAQSTHIRMESEKAVTDFGLPSPKRMRLENQRDDTGAPIDDMDDLYNTSRMGSPDSLKALQDPVIEMEPQQPKHDLPRFQLPGLGCGGVEGHLGGTQNEAGCTKIKEEGMALENKVVQNIQGDQGTDQETRGTTTPAPDIMEPSQLKSISEGSGGENMGTIKADSDMILGDIQAWTGNQNSRSPVSNVPVTEPPLAHKVQEAHQIQSSKVENDLESITDLVRSADVSQQPVQIPRPAGPGQDIANRDESKHTSVYIPPQTMLQNPAVHDAKSVTSKEDIQHGQTLDIVQQIDTTTSVKNDKDVLKSEQMDMDAEFELDSSPIESSSDSSSDSSSSDDSDDYEMLDPEEQARRLMQEDGGSDGEGGQGTGAGKAPLRTLNEKPDEIVPKPNIQITPEMKIQELGDVENLVENSVLIKAKTTGEYQVLETGSVLCLSDRSVIGVVAETLGRVQQPYYSVRFTNAAGIAEAGISKGTTIFYSERHSTTIFTQTLKAFKGSDASNLHDEEVADDEIEFSDDEAEAEYKRQQKHAKQAKREGRSGIADGFSRGPGGRSGNRGRGSTRRDHRGVTSGDDPRGSDQGVINYDDVETDEPYIPLARPSNLHEIMNNLDAAGGAPDQGVWNNGRGSGARGRGSNSRDYRGGRGDRRGRGGYEDRGYNAYSQPQPHYSQPQYPPSQMNPTSFYQPQSQYPPPSQYQYGPNHDAYQPSQYAPQSYGNHFQTPPNHQTYSQNQQPSLQTPVPNMPPGAFINPAFFAQAPQNQDLARNAFSPYQNTTNGHMPPPINRSSSSSSSGPASPGTNAAFLAAQDRVKLLQNLLNGSRGN